MAPDPMLEDDETIRERAEQPLRSVKVGAPAVILGRAAAVVLKSRPRAYHVRLDGPIERRIAWASGHEDLDHDAACRRCNETDRTRSAFVKRLYRTDPAQSGLYHVILDPTVLGIDRSVEVLTIAARGFFEANP
jgi:cytidylate kinase